MYLTKMLPSTSEVISVDCHNRYISPWHISTTEKCDRPTSFEENKTRMLPIVEECCPIFDRKPENYELSIMTTETAESEDTVGSILDIIRGSSDHVKESRQGKKTIQESCFLDTSNINNSGVKDRSPHTISHFPDDKLLTDNTKPRSFSNTNINLEKSYVKCIHGNVTIQYRKKWKDFSFSDRKSKFGNYFL